MRFPGDVIATLRLRHGDDRPRRARGDRQRGLALPRRPVALRSSPVIELRREDGVERIEIAREDSYRLELENLSDAIRGEAPLLLGREDALGQARVLEALHASAIVERSGLALGRCVDRGEREPLVVFARQPADADGADADVALEDGDAAEEEREERVEARPLDRVVADLLGELPRRPARRCGPRCTPSAARSGGCRGRRRPSSRPPRARRGRRRRRRRAEPEPRRRRARRCGGRDRASWRHFDLFP